MASALRALPLAEVGNALELVAGAGRRQPGRAAMSRTSCLCRCVRDALAVGELSAVDVTEAALARAERSARHNLFTTALPEDPMRAAVAADRAQVSGASLRSLHGVPITVKNNIDVAGVPTTAAVECLIGFDRAARPQDVPA